VRVEPDIAVSSRLPVLESAYVEVPASNMRRIVAARLAQSKAEVPHFYLSGSARMEALVAMRAQINDGAEVRVSINDLIVKAVAAAHARHPEMNVSWVDGSIRHWRHVDVGVAVATSRGLVTPVLRQVDRATVTAVAAEIGDLATRAHEGGLRLDELEGGSISVTNLGMFGTEEFSGIINPPQSAILAVGAIRDEAVVEDGELVAGKIARFTLSVDHRPLDGVMAAEWMRTFLKLVESPLRLLA
jgi:pyruvate dehydrogenase E2 component (dihydrolipoamide acetyltransferase)